MLRKYFGPLSYLKILHRNTRVFLYVNDDVNFLVYATKQCLINETLNKHLEIKQTLFEDVNTHA